VATYTVSYDAGEESGTPPESRTVSAGAVIALPGQENMIDPSGKTFYGWRTGGENYAAYANYTVNANTVFTAQWAADDITPDPALRAVPNAASTTVTPNILDSYSENSKNYYLIDVGYIYNTYVSTIMMCHYNGVTPILLSKTTLNSTTLTEALTGTVPESVTVSDTKSGTASLEGSWKKKFPVAGEFSVKLKLERTLSHTDSLTTTRSKETSVSRAETAARQFTVSFTVGEHRDPAGYYCYALYATSDVYFIVTTTADNKTLLGWDTVICDHDSSYLPHFDYAADGKFDNTPIKGTINFSDGFYKTLKAQAVLRLFRQSTVR